MTTILTDEQAEKLTLWKRTSEELAKLKAREMRLRKELTETLFSEAPEGTTTLTLTGDWKLKATVKMNRSLDEAALPGVLEQLGIGIVDDVVRYKPSLDLRNYKKLNDEQRAIFDEAVIMKPGAPTLQLVEPKIDPDD